MNSLHKNRSFVRTYGIIVLVVGLALIVGSPLWSQEGERSAFVGELLELLEGEGWTPEDVRALAAQEVDWEQVEGANPEVVALGLQFARSMDEDMQPMTQSLLAINLAQAAIEMEAVGIGELTITLNALEGVRNILTDIKAFRSGDMTGKELGETIRTTIRERVSKAAQEDAQDRERARAQESRHGYLVPDIPATEDEFPGSGYPPGGRP